MLEKEQVKAEIYACLQLDAKEYFSREKEQIEKILQNFHDEKSKELYQHMIKNLMTGRFVDFSAYEPNQYFGNDVIKGLAKGIFLDAGVCQGEEIDRALQTSEVFIHGFEPDARNYAYLLEKYKGEKRVEIHPYALWNCEEELCFTTNSVVPSTSRLGKRETSQKIEKIKAMPVDALLPILDKENEYFLKMDIEGAEYQALLGAAAFIKATHAKLAICIYHSLEDYIRLPMLLMERYPFYRFYFRQHSVTTGEGVLYALPRS